MERNNARIVQLEDAKFALLWDDDQGATQEAGPFDTSEAAASELVRLRAEDAAAAEKAKSSGVDAS